VLNDSQLAQLMLTGYSSDDAVLAATFDHVEDVDQDRFYLKDFGDTTVILFRGSLLFYNGKLQPDWARDFEVNQIERPDLGLVHYGFQIGLNDCINTALPLCQKNLILIGHSLGAARALIAAAFIAVGSYNVQIQKIVTWGTPKIGFQKFMSILAGIKCPIRCYQNHCGIIVDPVTMVPLIANYYQHPEQIGLQGPFALLLDQYHDHLRYAKFTPDTL
jgi:predicted lipase